MSEKKIAVLLSGCGVFDGSEIHEAVTVMLAIEQQGGTYQCFAPEGEQNVTNNHLTKQNVAEKRRMLVEAARIARGNIKSLKAYNPADYDALVIPGGMGAIVNLCTFAMEGPACAVHPDVEKAIKDTHTSEKPIVGLCIAPVLIARVLQKGTVTIGNDPETAMAISKTGATHSVCSAAQVCVDKENRLITTPCYMLDKSLKDVALSTSNAIKTLNEMLKNQ